MSAACTITERGTGLFFILVIMPTGFCGYGRSGWFAALVIIHTGYAGQQKHVQSYYQRK